MDLVGPPSARGLTQTGPPRSVQVPLVGLPAAMRQQEPRLCSSGLHRSRELTHSGMCDET